MHIGAKKLLERRQTDSRRRNSAHRNISNVSVETSVARGDKRRNSGDLWVALAVVYVANEKSERREVKRERLDTNERGSMNSREDGYKRATPQLFSSLVSMFHL